MLRINRDHKEEYRVAFNVAEEAESQPFSLCSPLDDTGDVCHYKGAIVSITNNTEIRNKGGKRIVGNLGFSRCYGTQKRRLTGIGQANQPYIGEGLELQNDLTLLCRFAGLCEAGSLIGGIFEEGISLPSTPPLKEELLLFVARNIKDKLPRCGIIYGGAKRYLYYHIATRRAGFESTRTTLATRGIYMPIETQVKKRPIVAVGTNINTPAITSISPIGSTFGDVFFATEVCRTSTALTRAAVDLHIVYKITLCHLPSAVA